MFKVNELLKATGGRLINAGSDISIRGISIDSRTINSGDAFIAIRGNNFDGHNFIAEAMKKGASCVMKEARFKIDAKTRSIGNRRKVVLIEVKDTVKALGDIARYQRRKFDIPVIAVTGSNGKTTTKEMLAWILSKKYKVLKNEGTKNNQIGLPLALLNLKDYHDIAVLEVGTNHFGEIDYLTGICQPNIGIITNIGPAHLEYLHNLEGVFKEKYALIRNLQRPYIAILNADDGLLRKEIERKDENRFILGFGVNKQSDFFATDTRALNGKTEFLLKKYRFTLNTLGVYNIYNALAVIAVARIFGIGYRSIVRRLCAFDFPQGRLKLTTKNRIKFIDDTYNSNPASLKHALEALDNLNIKGRKIFIMGDMLELGQDKKPFHYRVGRDVARVCDVFISVGELSKLTAKALISLGFDIKSLFVCTNCLQARDILLNKISLKEEDIVLVKGSRLMKMEEILKTN